MKELTAAERKEVILDIMTDIDEFCRSNGIRYSISSGTLLGAVRHGGFIPWDDDADMFMLREDFDRFVNTYRNRKYYIVYAPDESSPHFVVTGFAKVCDPDTRIENNWSHASHGIYVDVFPLDHVPENKKEQKYVMHKLMSINNRLHHRQKKDIFSRIKSYRHSLQWWWDKCQDTSHSYKYYSCPLVAHCLGAGNYRTVINKDRFDTLTEITFEGRKFLAFSDPHSYLRMVYGEDYMTPPPPEVRETHNEKAFRIEK